MVRRRIGVKEECTTKLGRERERAKREGKSLQSCMCVVEGERERE